MYARRPTRHWCRLADLTMSPDELISGTNTSSVWDSNDPIPLPSARPPLRRQRLLPEFWERAARPRQE